MHPAVAATERAIASRLVPGPPGGNVWRRWGVIAATHTGPNSVDVVIGTVTIPNVSYLASYSPTIGDTVIVDLTLAPSGADPLVIGKLA